MSKNPLILSLSLASVLAPLGLAPTPPVAPTKRPMTFEDDEGQAHGRYRCFGGRQVADLLGHHC